MPVPDPRMMTRPVYRWDTEHGCRAVGLRKELLSVPVAEGFHWSRYASVYVSEREAKEKENKRGGKRRKSVRAGNPRNVQVPLRTLYDCERRNLDGNYIDAPIETSEQNAINGVSPITKSIDGLVWQINIILHYDRQLSKIRILKLMTNFVIAYGAFNTRVIDVINCIWAKGRFSASN